MFVPPTRRRESPAVNAGSMADIAFLLLIFFLVTTQIVQEEGLFVLLPVWQETDEEIITEYADEQVLTVLVNANDQLMVEGEPAPAQKLKQLVMDHVLHSPYGPQEAIVSLAQDRGTSYATYLLIYNEILAAYWQLRDERAQEHFGLNFKELEVDRRRIIAREIPMLLSEAEPTDHRLGAF